LSTSVNRKNIQTKLMHCEGTYLHRPTSDFCLFFSFCRRMNRSNAR